jgi:hypothetical protein
LYSTGVSLFFLGWRYFLECRRYQTISVRGLGAAEGPPVGPGQSPGRGTRGAKPPGSSWIVEILRLKFLPEKKGHTTIFASILCIINEFEIKI